MGVFSTQPGYIIGRMRFICKSPITNSGTRDWGEDISTTRHEDWASKKGVEVKGLKIHQ